ncbi:DUF975 family protein [Mycoplasmatota bacterium]|nr:DUF975 family protein [Mycoplasmatota bacterium]
MVSKDFRKKAWEQLRTFYWNLLVVGLVLAAIMGSSAALVGLILSGPALIGVIAYRLNIIRTDTNDTDVLLAGFKGQIINYIIAFILRGLFIFLWTLLLVIPGIIKSFSYAMTFYILTDHPELEPTQAIKESQEMMRGHKWRLFKLYFSFIGWYILAALTFGVGFIFLEPYIQMSVANFYEDLKTRKVEII